MIVVVQLCFPHVSVMLFCCVQVLKLYAWELSFQEKILDIRNKELRILRKAAYLNAAASFSWTCAPFLVCLHRHIFWLSVWHFAH